MRFGVHILGDHETGLVRVWVGQIMTDHTSLAQQGDELRMAHDAANALLYVCILFGGDPLVLRSDRIAEFFLFGECLFVLVTG